MERLIRHPLCLLWLPLLYGLQSVPGTGALRTLFLACGVAHLVLLAKAGGHRATFAGTGGWKGPAVSFAALTAWLGFHAVALAKQPDKVFAAWLGEWSKIISLAAMGIVLARLWPRPGDLAVALLVGPLLHVAATLGHQATRFAGGHPPEWGMSWLGNYGYVSPFVTTGTALLLADGVARIHGRRLFDWNARWTILLLVLSLAAELLLRAKAGQLLTVLLAAVATLIAASRLALRGRVAWTAAVVCAAVLLLASSEERWQSGWAELRTAAAHPLDASTLTNNDHVSRSLPQGGDGSFFLRLTWARMAWEGIRTHPEGLGYGGDAFGRWVDERWGVPAAVSSHSGWLDFTLANGIIGGILLLAFVLALLASAWRAWRDNRPAGLALLLVGGHFFLRGMIDGIFYGSRLGGAALVIGLLFALSHARRPD